jgi:hypothetical protein
MPKKRQRLAPHFVVAHAALVEKWQKVAEFHHL